MRNVISGHVHDTVVLGSHRYANTLTVTQTGQITILSAGADGVYLGTASGQGNLANHGMITAGLGAYGVSQGGVGGIGVDFASAGQVSNAGLITGGAGGAVGTGNGGAGGDGILLAAGGVVRNTGTVIGGKGGSQTIYGTLGSGGAGGIGVDLSAGGTLVNAGSITGGTAGTGYAMTVSATGVYALDASVSNAGTIVGGLGGYYSSYAGGQGGAAFTLAGGHGTNTGLIQGGDGRGAFNGGGIGGVGVDLLAGGTLTNSGSITGGGGGYEYHGPSAAGGSGVYIANASRLVNTGTIIGNFDAVGVDVTGASRVGNGGTISGGGDAAGVLIQSGSLLNTGTVLGGTGDDAYTYHYSRNAHAGGAGVLILSGSAAIDKGVIRGGVGGGNAYQASYVAQGGIGVSITGGTLSVSSSGIVVGGVGGLSTHSKFLGGTGGMGVSLTGGRATSDGSITGGQGGVSKYDVGGNGGVGVYLNGGTLTTSGTIAGGAGGMGATGNGLTGDALQFGSAASTLIVDPGAVFAGSIAANNGAVDTLELSGQAAGVLSGFGTSITGFAIIAEDAHAHWTLGGSISGTGSVEIGTGAALTLNGAVSIASVGFASGGGETLFLAMPDQVTSMFSGFASGDTIDLKGLTATSLHYGGGTLTLLDGKAVVDTLHFAGALSGMDFGLMSDGHGGTDLMFETKSFGNTQGIAFGARAVPEHPSIDGLNHLLGEHVHLL